MRPLSARHEGERGGNLATLSQATHTHRPNQSKASAQELDIPVGCFLYTTLFAAHAGYYKKNTTSRKIMNFVNFIKSSLIHLIIGISLVILLCSNIYKKYSSTIALVKKIKTLQLLSVRDKRSRETQPLPPHSFAS